MENHKCPALAFSLANEADDLNLRNRLSRESRLGVYSTNYVNDEVFSNSAIIDMYANGHSMPASSVEEVGEEEADTLLQSINDTENWVIEHSQDAARRAVREIPTIHLAEAPENVKEVDDMSAITSDSSHSLQWFNDGLGPARELREFQAGRNISDTADPVKGQDGDHHEAGTVCNFSKFP
jgi:hypothetical protein